ncbi:MAG: hypothetical protein ACLUGB_06645 [Bacilli bacterium]
MASLKSITIPKNVKGFYYNGKDVFTYLGYVGSEKIDGFTIKGYRNTEAENTQTITALSLLLLMI